MKDKFCDTVGLAKKLLRKEMKRTIKGINREERQRQSELVLQKLIALPQYQKSKRVSIYLSMDTEINTLPILKHMFAAGKEVFIPRYKGQIMEMVKLHSVEDYERLPTTKWNIKQPADDDARENALESRGLDLICLPGVAFTKCGKRLGHGMAYYDKYLKIYALSKRHKPFLVALAFNEQLLDDIPTMEHDVNVDAIIAERTLH